MRKFYQVYADGSLQEIFELERKLLSDEAKGKIYAGILDYLAKEFGIKSFKEDEKQYVIELKKDGEVKISKPRLWEHGYWIQVSSAVSSRDAEIIFDCIVDAVKNRFKLEEAKKVVERLEKED